MKISLSWLFDFIDYPVSKVDVDQLVHLFNTRTAEIEHYEKITYDLHAMFTVQVSKIDAKKISAYCTELDKELILPYRTDAQQACRYMIIQEGTSYRWVTLADFHTDKEGLLPAVDITDKAMSGAWRKHIEATDYVLEVDNKSINHRPDLWGHYGIAREVAAFFGYKLKLLDVSKQRVEEFATSSAKSKNKISVKIEESHGCSRFAGLYCDNITYKASCLFTATRLLRVGAKPIDMMVDLTNYVMFDIGHPMHVFDVDAFSQNALTIRAAKPSETLTILDGQSLKLRQDDIVVADTKPLALAGIMGGKQSGYTSKTKSIFLEAAGFDPTMIRKTAQHFKLRTEASTRFEKHLDSMTNIAVLQRFLYLAQHAGVVDKVTESIISVGKVIKPAVCKITHDFIEQRLGSAITASFVTDTLTRLGFKVTSKKSKDDIVYSVTVPTNRMTKDIKIQEDILEEVIRMYGYENIAYKPLTRQVVPFDTQVIRNIATVKKHLAFGLHMHEVRDYLFYDESCIQRLKFEPGKTVQVKNPVSENYKQLVTSLVPHLCKNVELNANNETHIRLFEWNHIWPYVGKNIKEVSSLAGIVFDQKLINFYDIKAELQSLWDVLGIDVVWQKPIKQVAPWYDQHKVAELFVGKQSIGFAGIASQDFMRTIVQGQAFIFELDGGYIESLQSKQPVFKAWSKYQEVEYDISMLVPLHVTAHELQQAIAQASSIISDVQLVDFFEKEDWDNQRSLTFRYVMSDKAKTLDKKDIDEVVSKVEKVVQKYDAQIR